MSVYSENIEQILKNFQGAHNSLLEYDNYIYHIKFFMVDKATQQAYSKKRFNSFASGIDATTKSAIEANRLLNNHKVIYV